MVSKMIQEDPKGKQARTHTTKLDLSPALIAALQVTHLGYYETEEDAAKVYDRVAISLNGADAATNFPPSHYSRLGAAEFQGLGREDLQRALGVKPMDKSSQFRGVSRKKGKWEAKVRPRSANLAPAP